MKSDCGVGRSFTKPNGGIIDYYEIRIENFAQQVYPELGPTYLVGYDGISPGPTFRIETGREAVVRFINVGNDKATVTHLHGSPSKQLDGITDD
jgi:FtsP/CotA-like multicopper oxidase with cupredoxin domain